MKRVVLVASIGLISVQLYAQNWVNLMLDTDVNFFEVQEAFDNEWSDKKDLRGNGYKQFKRWEYFMEPRVYPSGDRIASKHYIDGLKKVSKMSDVESKSDQEWTPLGPTSWTGFGWNPGLGRVNASYADPTNPEHIYIATPAGGLWESIDNGDSWTPLTDTLVAIGASAIAVHPENTDIIYLATGDGNGSDTYSFGVVKSEDGGQSWETTNLIFEIEDQIRCTDMLMDPNNPDKLFVTSSQGLFVTENGGESWDQVLNGFLRDVAIHPTNPEIVYTCGTRFFKSVDGGNSFDQISAGLPNSGAVSRMEIAVTSANDELVYVVAGDASTFGFLGFYRSTNEGNSFQLRSNSPNIMHWSETGDGDGGQTWYDLAIAASPEDEDRVFVGGVNVWETTNGGNNWNIRSHWFYPPNVGYTHADIHSLDFFGNTLYCGSDGGIFRSNNNGISWEDISQGLQISQFYRIAVSATDPSLILAGSQDNGTNLFSSENGYVHLLGGDGNGAAIDYTNDDIMYASFPGGSYQRSTDGGLSFSSLTGDILETGAWVTPFEIHPTDPSILFAAYENVWKFENNSWNVISNIGSGSTLRALKVAPSDPDVIMVSTFSSLYRTENGGNDWFTVSNGLPNLFITAIEIDPQNSERVWVTFSGYQEDNKVYFSEDGGDSWENASENLPNVPVNCIHYLNGSDDGIYIGTDVGVFYNDNELTNWSPYNNGLPNVIVNQLLFHYPSQQIILGSYGRGVWTNVFFDAGELSPIANFSSDVNQICPGTEVTFNDLSLNVTGNIQWTFEGGVPATSMESNPTVIYNSAGLYPVKLEVFNSDEADSLIIEEFIEVIAGTNPPLIEDFENQTEQLDGWFISENNQNINFSLTEEAGFMSDNSLILENYNLSGSGLVRFTSGIIDVSQLDTVFISLRAAFARQTNSGAESMRVFINTDCSENWVLKKVFSSNTLSSIEPTDQYYVPTSDSEWNYLLVDNIAPDERTESFRFRIQFSQNGGNNLYIDDINLSQENTLSSNIIQPKFNGDVSLYPNPTSGDVQISINANTSERLILRLFNSEGKLLLNDDPVQVKEGNQTLLVSMNTLKPGAYILEIEGESGVTHKKIVLTTE